MKKRLTAGFCAGCTLLALVAAAAGPGTDSDPLISKSYIDAVVFPYIDNSVSAATNSVLEIVYVDAGHILRCKAGTELILRSGSAEAIASPQGGLSDVTAGADLAQGTPLTANHLLIVPRNDNRGAYAVTDCIFMVRGGYSIE